MNRTPQSTHHKKNPQTHRTARTQYSFFFFFFELLHHRYSFLMVSIIVAVFLLAYWFGGSGVVLPPTAQWNWEATLQSAGQFSSDILSLNFTVW